MPVDQHMIQHVKQALYDTDHAATEVERTPFRNRFHHCLRVYALANVFLQEEDVDPEVLPIAALFHDVGKAAGKDHALLSARIAEAYLGQQRYPSIIIEEVLYCISHHSSSSSFDSLRDNRNLFALKDCDVLDEIGMTGIVWTVLNSALRDPTISSYYAVLDRLNAIHTDDDIRKKSESRFTDTGRRLMYERLSREKDLIEHFTQELYYYELHPFVEDDNVLSHASLE